MSIECQFSSRHEWLAELLAAHERMEVDEQLPVRATIENRADAKFYIINNISVLGGFVANGMLHSLRVYVGQEMGQGDPKPSDARKAALAIVEEIQQQCERLGLACRPGKYEVAAAK